MNNETETMDFDTGTLTELELMGWANRIKAERKLTHDDIRYEISYLFGREPDDPLSKAYISNALNMRGAKTNGVGMSIAMIKHYEGIDVEKTPRYKVI